MQPNKNKPVISVPTDTQVMKTIVAEEKINQNAALAELAVAKENLAYQIECNEDLNNKVDRLTREKVEQDEIILGLRNKLRGLQDAKNCFVQIMGNGSIETVLEGDWTFADLRAIQRPIASALRQKQQDAVNRMREEISRAQKENKITDNKDATNDNE